MKVVEMYLAVGKGYVNEEVLSMCRLGRCVTLAETAGTV